MWSWRDDPLVASAAAIARAGDESTRVLLLYRADLDAAMHAHGVDSAPAHHVLRDVEQTVRGLRAAAAAAHRPLTLALTSDHGMADARTTHDVRSHIAATGLRMPEDYLAFYDSTMARFWFHTAGARDRIAQALAALPVGEVMSAADLARHGCAFTDNRYGDLVFLMPVGHQIAPSCMGITAPIAMHGYTPDDPVMDACFVSTGIGSDATSILDVAPTIWRAVADHAA